MLENLQEMRVWQSLVTTEKERINEDNASVGDDWKFKGSGEVLGKSDEALDYFTRLLF